MNKVCGIKGPDSRGNGLNGTYYTGHALNSMQNAGIYPSMVQSAIRTGRVFAGKDGTLIYDDVFNIMNRITVVASAEGRVITTYWR